MVRKRKEKKHRCRRESPVVVHVLATRGGVDVIAAVVSSSRGGCVSTSSLPRRSSGPRWWLRGD